jgi:hypothetical protein
MSVVIPGAVSSCRECAKDMEEYFAKHSLASSTEEEFTRNLEAYMKKRVAERRPDP